MNLHRIAITGLVLSLGLAGCASHELPPSTAASARTIGIVSALGDEIHFARSGMTVFGNAVSQGSISDWHIDDRVLDRAKKDLAGQHEIVTLKAAPESLEQLGGDLNPLLAGGMSEALAGVVQQQHAQADLWVAIAPKCATEAGYTGPLPCGVSVSRFEGIFGPPPAWAVILATVTIFDGKTLKPIAQSDLLIEHGDCFPVTGNSFLAIGRPGCEPAVDLGTAYAVNQWTDYGPQQKAVIRDGLLDALGPSIDFTLRRLKVNG